MRDLLLNKVSARTRSESITSLTMQIDLVVAE